MSEIMQFLIVVSRTLLFQIVALFLSEGKEGNFQNEKNIPIIHLEFVFLCFSDFVLRKPTEFVDLDLTHIVKWLAQLLITR